MAPRDARRVARVEPTRGSSREAGFDAIIVENFGDAPFFADARAAGHHRRDDGVRCSPRAPRRRACPLGVNVLRNDAEAALSIAAATGASFVRINVLTGARVTDQGVVQGARGRDAALARARSTRRTSPSGPTST